MDAVLLTLALVSFAAAIGFAVVAWRALDDQGRRSAARVASLSGAIRDTRPAAPVAVASLFEKESGAMMRGRPLIKAAVVGALGVALVVYVAMSTSRSGIEPAPVAAMPAAVTSGAPLELMTMRHAREGDSLIVTGLVRNPASGASVTRIAAVIFTFDGNGAFVASARAPLDFTTLAAGDESPFVVTVPEAGEIARYRVSFRTEAGVVRHVDRRSAGQLARVD